MLAVLFWITAAVLAHTYVGYGLLVILAGRLRAGRPVVSPRSPLDVELVVAAHNEAGRIAGKLRNSLELETGPHRFEVVVVSDGSTDGTVEEVKRFSDRGVRVVDRPEHAGKVAALNAAIRTLRGDVAIFSDANSALGPDALLQLVRHFGDPAVGGVCGRLTVPRRRRGWMGRAERLYWAYDDALKAAESRLGGAVSAQGSLYAVRRELLRPLPPAVCDDLSNSLSVVAQGGRLVFEPGAVAEEEVASDLGGEFRRRVRSTERGFRGLFVHPQLLNPARHGIYALQLLSHKLLRRLSPFLLLLLALLSLALAPRHPIFLGAALAQATFYAVAAAAAAIPILRRVPGLGIPLFFVTGHLSMGLGVINVLRGRRTDRWTPLRETGDEDRGDGTVKTG